MLDDRAALGVAVDAEHADIAKGGVAGEDVDANRGKGDAGRVLTEVETALLGIEAGDGGPNRDGFTIERVEAALEPLPAKLELGAGKVFQPIRVAITGTTISPGIFESVAALGREETCARVESARARLAEAAE